MRLPHVSIQGLEAEAELTEISRPELAHPEFDREQAGEAAMEEEQIDQEYKKTSRRGHV